MVVVKLTISVLLWLGQKFPGKGVLKKRIVTPGAKSYMS